MGEELFSSPEQSRCYDGEAEGPNYPPCDVVCEAIRTDRVWLKPRSYHFFSWGRRGDCLQMNMHQIYNGNNFLTHYVISSASLLAERT